MQAYYFEIITIPLEAIIIFAILFRKTTKGMANKLFLWMNVSNMFVAVLDVFNGALKEPGLASHVAAGFSNIFSILYFFFRNGLSLFYLCFLLYYFRLNRWGKKLWFNILLYLPFAIMTGLIFTNPAHHLLFTTTMEEGYQRGQWIIILYILSGIYLLEGVALLFYGKKLIDTSKWLALLSNYVFSFFAIGLQFAIENLMVELVSTAIAFLLITFVVLRPEELTEPKSGLPSITAFEQELKKVILTKENAQILFIRIKNNAKIRTFLGEEGLMKSFDYFCEDVQAYGKQYKVRIEIFFEQPNMFYLLIDDDKFDPKNTFDYLTQRSYEIEHSEIQEQEEAAMRLIGTSIKLPNPGLTHHDILRLGHQFDMYMAKEKRYVEGNEIISSLSYIVSVNLSNIIKNGIANHNFRVYYQPIYDFETKSFKSAEALVRLKDDQYGFIPPGILIPAAEKRNLLQPISDFVLEEVYRFIGSQDFDKLGVEYIEINLSMQQCTDVDLPKQIKSLEEKHHVEPKRVNFEITESAFSQSNKVLAKNVEELMNRGYRFSMDDYGTGYSNMNRLINIPFEIIKVDKSLVDAASTKEGRTILEKSVNMIKELHKVPLAEGVEEKDKLDLLESLGVKYIQGFYFSQPIPEADYLKFVAEHNETK